MKRLIGLILLTGIIYGGYIYYQRSRESQVTFATPPMSNGNNVIVANASDKIEDFAAVLGASIGNTFENGKELLSNATSGRSEPIINELVTKTTETLKDLPRKEAEKIKYEFCRGVIEEYESK